jgi:hypothetical protein
MKITNPSCGHGNEGVKVSAVAALLYLPWFLGHFDMNRTNPSSGHGYLGAKVSAAALL